MIKDHNNAEYHARYNANVHCILATRYNRLDFWAAIVAALTATGSAIAGYAGALGIVWQALLLLSAILSTVRPVCRWSDLYAKHHALALAYQQVEWRLKTMPLADAEAEFAKLASMETTAEPMGWANVEKRADARARSQLKYAPA